jgi:hypothetical protein
MSRGNTVGIGTGDAITRGQHQARRQTDVNRMFRVAEASATSIIRTTRDKS